MYYKFKAAVQKEEVDDGGFQHHDTRAFGNFDW